MSTIFINYRRQDSAGKTFALRQALLKYFSEAELFLDVKGLEGGVKFDVQLEKTVSSADAMVVVIGPNWLDSTDEDGVRRLQKEDDFVRIEIAKALSYGKPILPVLLDDTKMPSAEDLPADLQGLSRHNARTLRLDRMDDDVREIARALKTMSKRDSRVPLWWTAAGAAAALVLGMWLGPYLHEWTKHLTGGGWGPYEMRKLDSDATKLLAEVRKTHDVEDLGDVKATFAALERFHLFMRHIQRL